MIPVRGLLFPFAKHIIEHQSTAQPRQRRRSAVGLVDLGRRTRRWTLRSPNVNLQARPILSLGSHF